MNFGTNEFLPQMRPLHERKPTLVSTLDVGSFKTCCLIARLIPMRSGGNGIRASLSSEAASRTHRIELLGMGHRRSRGVKSGVVVDLEAAEQSIRLAVDAAERMAGVTVESLIVSLSAGRLNSEAYAAEIALEDHPVKSKDVARILRIVAEHDLTQDRCVVHSLPIGYALDKESGVADPLGMIGERLGVNMHVVTAERAPALNLERAINRAHLSVEAMAAAPYVSGLATLVEDEAGMGCACIDMGGGTTTLSVFLDGRFVFCDAIALGGNHVTMDLARGLSSPLDDAEKLKTMHGSALASQGRENDPVSVPGLGDDERDPPNQVPRNQLTRIIRPRVEETLETIRDRLHHSGFASAVGRRIVLCGGASQLNGASEVARRIFSRTVRIGRPLGVDSMPESAKGPAFAAAAGLLAYPQVAHLERNGSRRAFAGRWMSSEGSAAASGAFGKFGSWLRESF